ncbi:hypothetical protein PMG71_00895 [Roseofilum sp. BLCC_M154]|uniref:Uncharacterized protein n=1 Tax=Roseofilum acuticapitatum BLCC-M154 TaxID=3022444 RepID=A0ABT7APG1_9CYAN|nr:hypothetical protein [Roseofilum acuticapitatum]MDJ1167978.1 hypothetical protein [Roseofilum acuticapitatum BLCC-M154]
MKICNKIEGMAPWIQRFALLWCTALKAQSHVPQPYSLFPSAKRYIGLQLYPSPEEPTLPLGLELILLGDRQDPPLSRFFRGIKGDQNVPYSRENCWIPGVGASRSLDF